LASCVNLPFSKRLKRRFAVASESEDGHDGEDDTSPGKSHDDTSERGAGDTDENSPAVAEQFGRRAGQECLDQRLADTERAKRKADPEAIPAERVETPKVPNKYRRPLRRRSR
jgi:hypothetical protein